MSYKKVTIILLIVLFLFGIYIFFFKNKHEQENISDKKSNTSLNENLGNNSESENKKLTEQNEKMKASKPSQEEAMQYISRFNANDKLNVKTVYSNVEDFVNVLKSNSHMRLSSSSNYYFVDNIVAIPKIAEQKNKEILWQDSSNFYYKSSTTYQNYDQNKYIVMLDKETGRFALTSGVYVLKYKNTIENKLEFENKNRIKILSDFNSDKIIIVKAEKGSNLLEIYKKLKSEKNIDKVDLEITSSDIKAN